MVDKGYDDITVIVEGFEIRSIKSLLCGRNKLLHKLIKDETFPGILELCDKVTINGFHELEKYYSGGKIILTDRNIMDILSICLFYNEMSLFCKCKSYIIDHFNDTIMSKILDYLPILSSNQLTELKDLTTSYLNFNSYKLLADNVIVELSMTALEYILDNQYLIIPNETYLLLQLFKYHDYVKNNNNNNKNGDKNDDEDSNKIFDEKFQLLLRYVNVNNIDYYSISLDHLQLLNLTDIKTHPKFNNCLRLYSDVLTQIKCEYFQQMLVDYYQKQEVILTIDSIYIICY